ncbi:MAG: hypothetical protein HY898_10190 [Deltaproteobacteria bacterium]|nr:hypothetical protein [Deltaproteobacteria bacterium]
MLAALTAGTLGLGLALGCQAEPRVRPTPAPAETVSVAAAVPTTLFDPLNPDRPIEYDSSPRGTHTSWVTARPGFQSSLSSADRGGISPCSTQEVDTSAFDGWTSLSKGRFVAPRESAIDAAGRFDLVMHFHGDAPVLRELVHSGQKLVLYTLTLDPSEAYGALFAGSGLFNSIVLQIEGALSKSRGRPAHVGHIAVSAWSAGFTGISALLGQPEAGRLDAMVLIDGLHAPRLAESLDRSLQPFVDYARRAVAGERFMLVTHSSIDPPDFASTTETAHHLIAAVGGQPQAVHRKDALGLEMVEFFTAGSFHVRGYAGNDKADHCAQLALLRDAFTALGKRWQP